MLQFFNEINDLLEVPLTSVAGEYQYVNLAGRAVYVQGYKDLLTFEDNKIGLKLKEGELMITGKKLVIKDLNINSIVVEGIIQKVEVLK